MIVIGIPKTALPFRARNLDSSSRAVIELTRGLANIGMMMGGICNASCLSLVELTVIICETMSARLCRDKRKFEYSMIIQ